MAIFEDRKSAAEAKFKNDQEFQFKVIAGAAAQQAPRPGGRRSKWACQARMPRPTPSRS